MSEAALIGVMLAQAVYVTGVYNQMAGNGPTRRNSMIVIFIPEKRAAGKNVSSLPKLSYVHSSESPPVQ